MVERFLNFFDSISHFFSFVGSLITEIGSFFPSYITMALGMIMAFALLILILRFANAIISVAKTIVTGVLTFLGG